VEISEILESNGKLTLQQIFDQHSYIKNVSTISLQLNRMIRKGHVKKIYNDLGPDVYELIDPVSSAGRTKLRLICPGNCGRKFCKEESA